MGGARFGGRGDARQGEEEDEGGLQVPDHIRMVTPIATGIRSTAVSPHRKKFIRPDKPPKPPFIAICEKSDSS
ncbi:hypothetical protein GCM10023259_093350 [Thermocatellispora tengchongensis]